MDDNIERDYSYKENATGTNVKEPNIIIKEPNMKIIDELDQICLNPEIDLETETKRKDECQIELRNKWYVNPKKECISVQKSVKKITQEKDCDLYCN